MRTHQIDEEYATFHASRSYCEKSGDIWRLLSKQKQQERVEVLNDKYISN